MAQNEVDSFVTKFKHLWSAGFKATLTIEAVNGEASVVLKSGLGNIKPHHLLGHHGLPYRPRGPAYHRRQERRQAARGAAVGGDSSPTVEVRDSKDAASPAAKAGEALKETEAEQADLKKEAAGKVEEDISFSCLICDFKSNWENGLQIHSSKKHKKIEQIDGINDDDIEDDKYSGTIRYWETGRLGTVYQCFLDANYIIENSELIEEVKATEKQKVLEARKAAIGKHYRCYPPWE